MAGWLAVLARLNPLTYAVDGFRSLMLRGWEGSLLLQLSAALVAFDVVLGWLGVRVFRRRLSG